MLHLTESSCCASSPFPRSHFSMCMRAHMQVGRGRCVEGACLAETSKIDVGIGSEVDKNGSSESSLLARTRSSKVQRRWSDAEHGFCWEIPANAHVNTHFGLAPLPSGVSVSKWEPLSGAQWAWDSVRVMGSWLAVCRCLCSLFPSFLWVGCRQRGGTANNRRGSGGSRDTVTDRFRRRLSAHTLHAFTLWQSKLCLSNNLLIDL